MPTPAEIEADFWKALRSDMTAFLSCKGAEPRPMTMIVDGDDDRGPLFSFTSSDTDLGKVLDHEAKVGGMTFVSKNHGIWASARGTMWLESDEAVKDRLWNPHVAAWFEGGRDDPKMRLVRFEADDAEIWEDGSSLVAGIKSLMGRDPKKDYQDKVAHVRLDD